MWLHAQVMMGTTRATPTAIAQPPNRNASVMQRPSTPCYAVQIDREVTQPSSFNAKAAESKYNPKYSAFMAALATGYFTTTEENEGFWLEVVEGALPRDLKGTLFRYVLDDWEKHHCTYTTQQRPRAL